jgi:hypothetical protein
MARVCHISLMSTRRVALTFEVLQYEDGQPFVALVFMKDGRPVPIEGRLFTFDLAAGTTQLEAETLARLLSRRVTHLAETVAAEPEVGDAAHEKVLAEQAT